MLFHEKRGHYPFMKPSAAVSRDGSVDDVAEAKDVNEKGDFISATQHAKDEGV